MQDKRERPEFQQLGEHGAIPGAPNGPPFDNTEESQILAFASGLFVPGGATGSGAHSSRSEKSDLASANAEPLPALAKPHTTAAEPVAPIQNPESEIQNPTFFPIRDLPKIAHEDADWIWDGYLARGAVTILVSEPKAGKSTLVFGLMQKLLAGAPFLGRATVSCATAGSSSSAPSEDANSRPESTTAENCDRSGAPIDVHATPAAALLDKPAVAHPLQNPESKIQNPGVIYFSEEPLSTLREKAERFELPIHGERIQLVSRRQKPNQKVDLETALERAVEKAQAIGAGLIVIDTLSAWSGLRAEQENSAAPCEALMSKFTDAATRSNTALLLVHHTRKDGLSARGSTVLTGSADIVLKFKRDMSGSSDTSSTLRVDSRFSNAPEPLTFELTDDGYKTIGTGKAAIRKHAKVYDLLPNSPPGLTRDELCNASALTRWQVRCALSELIGSGAVTASGTGLRGDGVRFVRTVA